MSNKNLVEYENLKSLELFFQECEELLLNEENHKLFNYPLEDNTSWDDIKIKSSNETFLQNLRHNINVYAIFGMTKNEQEYTLKYIGQTKSIEARSRLSNHLIKKDKGTGAKLENVKQYIKNGGKIKISCIFIEPESLRHYIEEKLIQKYINPKMWNKHK